MADTINLFGSKVPKKTAFIVGGGVLVIGGIIYYRQKQASNAAAANTAASSAGANTGTDPATGYPYGSAEDVAALQNQGQYISPDNASSFASGQVIGYDGNGNPIYGSGSYNNGYNQGPGSFIDNPQWAQYVENYLEQTEGADPTTVGNAIGKYLSGQPLTSAMISIVQNAIGIGGNPPVPGINGNPPGYVTSNSNGGGGQNVTVPDVIGMEQVAAFATIQSLGLKPKGSAVQPGKVLYVKTESPSAGSSVASGSTITLTSQTVSSHPPGNQTVPVPNVVGLSKGEAHNVIAAAQLWPIDGSFKKGDASKKVRSQTPTRGKQVTKNSKVTYR